MSNSLHSVADGLLTVAQATDLVQLSRSSIYAAMDRGELPYAKFGRARRLPKIALLNWAAAHMTGGWATTPGISANGLGQNVGPEMQRAPADQSKRLAALSSDKDPVDDAHCTATSSTRPSVHQ